MGIVNSPKEITLGILSLIFIIVGSTLVINSLLVGGNPLNLFIFIMGFSQELGGNILDDYSIEMGFFIGLFLLIVGGSSFSYIYKSFYKL